MAAATIDPAVLLNIGEMIDLAISTPEIGVVDFGMLHTVLHCLAQQLHVQDKNVELRGSIAALPVGRDTNQTVTVKEIVVNTDGKVEDAKPSNEEKVEPSTQTHAPPESILVVERVRRTIPKEHGKKTDASKAPRKPPHSVTPHSLKTQDQPAPHAAGSTERLSLVTLSKFSVLESAVDDLKERVYGSLPKNEDILEEVRSQTNLKAITDMWTSLNVSSRLEAAETGIAKLSSLVQDLISDTGGLQDAFREHSKSLLPVMAAPPGTEPGMITQQGVPHYVGAEHQQGVLPQPEVHPQVGSVQFPGAVQPELSLQSGTQTYPETAAHSKSPGMLPPEITAPGTTPTPGIIPGTTPTAFASPLYPIQPGVVPATKEELAAAQVFLQRLHADVQQLMGDFYKAMEDLMPGMERPARPPMPPLTPLSTATTTSLSPTPWPMFTASPDSPKPPGIETQADYYPQTVQISVADVMNRLIEIERKLKECCENVNKQDGVVHDHINSFQDQIEYLSRQVASTQEVPGSNLSPDIANDLKGFMKLFQTVQGMQDELKQVHETALQLAAEKEDRQDRINAIIEQIEVLKTIKLDREDMAEAMAGKADLRMLARKVSHDQFELACDDLSRGLDHALEKLNMQEALWQQALDDIQREIEMKLDKMELSPVKEFFNSKLKQLQENLKQIASLRREVEAAGTKRKLLRDVNCISCDAKAVMPMEAEASLPTSKPLPANLSMKPYLSYELDAIRKTQANNLPQRNLHDWEHIDRQVSPSKVPQKVRSEHDKHLCNRYCGGSHTVTTPAQRVARLGHFVKQWGPDVLPLSSGLAAGEDGKMYKVSKAEGNSAGPGGAMDSSRTPKVPPKKSERPNSPEKRSIVISAECRCLEDDHQTKSSM